MREQYQHIMMLAMSMALNPDSMIDVVTNNFACLSKKLHMSKAALGPQVHEGSHSVTLPST